MARVGAACQGKATGYSLGDGTWCYGPPTRTNAISVRIRRIPPQPPSPASHARRLMNEGLPISYYFSRTTQHAREKQGNSIRRVFCGAERRSIASALLYQSACAGPTLGDLLGRSPRARRLWRRWLLDENQVACGAGVLRDCNCSVRRRRGDRVRAGGSVTALAEPRLAPLSLYRLDPPPEVSSSRARRRPERRGSRTRASRATRAAALALAAAALALDAPPSPPSRPPPSKTQLAERHGASRAVPPPLLEIRPPARTTAAAICASTDRRAGDRPRRRRPRRRHHRRPRTGVPRHHSHDAPSTAEAASPPPVRRRHRRESLKKKTRAVVRHRPRRRRRDGSCSPRRTGAAASPLSIPIECRPPPPPLPLSVVPEHGRVAGVIRPWETRCTFLACGGCAPWPLCLAYPGLAVDASTAADGLAGGVSPPHAPVSSKYPRRVWSPWRRRRRLRWRRRAARRAGRRRRCAASPTNRKEKTLSFRTTRR